MRSFIRICCKLGKIWQPKLDKEMNAKGVSNVARGDHTCDVVWIYNFNNYISPFPLKCFS